MLVGAGSANWQLAPLDQRSICQAQAFSSVARLRSKSDNRVMMAFLCALFLSLPPYGEAADLYLAPGPSLIHMTFDRRALPAGIQSLATLLRSQTAGNGNIYRSAYRHRRKSRCDI